MYGWQKDGNGTSQIRKYLGLYKDKQHKKNPTPESHAVDGVALAASEFIGFKPFVTKNSHGHDWQGKVTITESVFRVITRPAYFRRALHFDNPSKGGTRKRKGGTITLFGCLGARSLGDEASPGVDRGDFSGLMFCFPQLIVVC